MQGSHPPSPLSNTPHHHHNLPNVQNNIYGSAMHHKRKKEPPISWVVNIPGNNTPMLFGHVMVWTRATKQFNTIREGLHQRNIVLDM